MYMIHKSTYQPICDEATNTHTCQKSVHPIIRIPSDKVTYLMKMFVNARMVFPTMDPINAKVSEQKENDR